MPKSSAIIYRNWAVEYGRIADGYATWEPGAPASNMLTPRPGQVAIHDGSATSAIVWRVDIGADIGSSSNVVGRPVGGVALINCNIVLDPSDASLVVCRLIDADGSESTCDASPVALNGSESSISSIVFLVADDATGSADLSRVVAVQFEADSSLTFGSRDPWTGAIAEAALRTGTVVAGPIWRPKRGIRLAGHAPGVTDVSQVVRSIGGTVWTSPQTRMRRIGGEFALLSEAEVEAQPPLCGLRQMAEHCGISRPVLIIPSDADAQRMHQQVVFGYFAEDLTWSAIDKAEDDAGREIQFRCQFTIVEGK